MTKNSLSAEASAKAGKIILGIIIAAVIIGGICWAARREAAIPVAEEDVIKIGAILPMTGNAAIYGESMRQGAELATEQINKLNSKKVEIIFEDSKGDPKEALSAFNKLKDNTNVVITAISGGCFSNSAFD